VDALVAETRPLIPQERLERVLARPGAHDPIPALQKLQKFNGTYVLIGSLAGALRGTDELVPSVDICPRPTALLPAQLNGASSVMPISIASKPPGSMGYDDLRRGASDEAIRHGISLTLGRPPTSLARVRARRFTRSSLFAAGAAAC
jgi:hypothetical protein